MMLYNSDSKYAFMSKDYLAKRNEFYKKLTDAGVKAYRVHDGWVDTDTHEVTFFNNPLEWERDSMCYHPMDTILQVGDLIFIGNYVFGGRFARITEVLESTDIVQVYRYTPLYDYMDGFDKFITKFTYPNKHTPFFERLKYRLGIYQPKFQKDII